ncbi:hypothetical protein B0H10DRAFT_1944453 [Mycena sp. CBHHK59/15]|nr:hypothetical protein B0H10DRAFT_1944453 [Mycena sp. CBHHK59/15]
MPYSDSEVAALQRQALHAIVSGGFPLNTFEDPEMLILFGMLRTTVPVIMPTGKVVGGTNAWKCQKRDAVNTLCLNVDFKSYLIELVEVTALNKDGPSLCDLFADMIDHMEEKYGDYFKVNDMAAGIAKEATALITWINNHGKVHKILDDAQAIISKDQNASRIIILAYLVANLTHWTTHFLAVLQKHSAIIAAEVGAAMSTEGDCLKEDAERFCALIKDVSFWNCLEMVLGDLKPIYALYEFSHVYLLDLQAHAKQLYRRMKGHPSNEDTPEQKKMKETEVSKVFKQYLTGTRDFGDFDSVEWEATFVWEVFAGSSALAELADFAITILQIVANQAGCEHTFSWTKVEESDHHN